MLPETENQKQVIRSKIPSEPRLAKTRFLVAILLLVIGGLGGYHLGALNENKKLVSSPASVRIRNAVTPSPKPSLPPLDFTLESAKPITQIDTSSWRMFEDDRVGLRFRYPLEWGQADVTYRVNSCTSSIPENQCPSSGTIFGIYFPL
jgi:hypothetical protein